MNLAIIGKIVKGRIIRKTETNYMVEIEGGLIGLLPVYQMQQYHLDSEVEGLVIKPLLTPTGIQYKMSRDIDYIQKVFEEIAPSLRSGRAYIEKIVRIPGQKTKIAVAKTNEKDGINPVAMCIGEGGAYVMALQERLNTKEFIDVIEYKPDLASFIKEALKPGKVEDVVLDFSTRTATALIEPEDTGLVLGKKGVNLRLASRMADCTIYIEENGVYIRSFGFTEKTTIELLKAKINTSDRLFELFETNNGDKKVSKEAFDEILQKVEFVDEEPAEETEYECPECGHTFMLNSDAESFICPHCHAELVFEDDEEDEEEENE